MSFFRTLFIINMSIFYCYFMIIVMIWRRIFKTFEALTERNIPPSCLTLPDLTHSYIQLPGVKLHYVEKGDKSKPLMLFIHGFPEFWFTWRHQLIEFSKDYWTVAVDMRGYGDSEKPSGISKYKLEILVEDIANLIKSLGKEKAILVGHDWGGAVMWFFTMKYPQMVEKYIALNSPHPISFKTSIEIDIRQFFLSWYVFFFQAPWLPEMWMRANDMNFFSSALKDGNNIPSPITDEEIEAYKFTFKDPDSFTAPINYYRANMFSEPKIKPNRDEILGPGLLIYGENDFYINLKTIQRSKEYVKNLEIKVIKGINHFVQQNAPEEVNLTIKKFLNLKS